MVLTQSPVRKQVAPKNPHFPLVECPFCQENGVSTASNPGFAGKMPIRRRRIGIPAAKWRFDAVESAFSRQNGDSTGGGSPFFRQNADSTRANWHFFDRMPIRRRRKRRFFGGRPVRRRGNPRFFDGRPVRPGREGIPLAQGRSGTEGSDVPPGGSGFAARAMASTAPDGLSAPGKRGLDGGRRFITASRRWFCRERAQRAQRTAEKSFRACLKMGKRNLFSRRQIGWLGVALLGSVSIRVHRCASAVELRNSGWKERDQPP